jgi:serine/threonine protein kinase
MAPEQIEGRAGITTDLFATGIVLWELFSGKRLFARENAAATLLAVMAAKVPEVGGSDAASWNGFLARVLARDPTARFATARDMLEALEAIPDTHHEDAAAELGVLVARFVSEPDTGDTSDSQQTVREDLNAGETSRTRTPSGYGSAS